MNLFHKLHRPPTEYAVVLAKNSSRREFHASMTINPIEFLFVAEVFIPQAAFCP
jgi:hypothetical protein